MLLLDQFQRRILGHTHRNGHTNGHVARPNRASLMQEEQEAALEEGLNGRPLEQKVLLCAFNFALSLQTWGVYSCWTLESGRPIYSSSLSPGPQCTPRELPITVTLSSEQAI